MNSRFIVIIMLMLITFNSVCLAEMALYPAESLSLEQKKFMADEIKTIKFSAGLAFLGYGLMYTPEDMERTGYPATMVVSCGIISYIYLASMNKSRRSIGGLVYNKHTGSISIQRDMTPTLKAYSAFLLFVFAYSAEMEATSYTNEPYYGFCRYGGLALMLTAVAIETADVFKKMPKKELESKSRYDLALDIKPDYMGVKIARSF